MLELFFTLDNKAAPVRVIVICSDSNRDFPFTTQHRFPNFMAYKSALFKIMGR